MNTMHLIDTTGCTHTVALGPGSVLLDEKPCILFVQDSQMKLVSSDPTRGMITVLPAALWHAYAGGDPTPEAAGLILAELLARHAAMQKIAELTWRMQPLFDEIDLHLHQHQEFPEPSCCFDTFTLQLLRTYDGTDEHVAALTRLLRQSPETITSWLARIGLLAAPGHEEVPPLQGQIPTVSDKQMDEPPGESTPSDEQATEQPASPATSEHTDALLAVDARGRKRGYLWTQEHERLLEDAVKTSQQTSTNGKIREIAERFGWPFHVVDYRMRQLAKRTPPSQPEPEGQAEMEPAPNTPPLGDAPPLGPLCLPVGAFLWDVKLDGSLQRWQLDVAYGTFPHAPGAHVVYREKEYRLQRVWHGIIEVTAVAPGAVDGEERLAVTAVTAV